MTVVNLWLTTGIALNSSTSTSDLVTAIILEELAPTPMAVPDLGSGHHLLYGHPVLGIIFAFHLFTRYSEMVLPIVTTVATGFLEAAWVWAPKHLLLVWQLCTSAARRTPEKPGDARQTYHLLLLALLKFVQQALWECPLELTLRDSSLAVCRQTQYFCLACTICGFLDIHFKTKGTEQVTLLTLDHCLKHCFTITAHTLKPRPFISKRRHLNANRVSFVWSQVTKQPFVNTLGKV